MFQTTTVTTILNALLVSAGEILTTNLPIVLTFALSIAALFWAIRWVFRAFRGR